MMLSEERGNRGKPATTHSGSVRCKLRSQDNSRLKASPEGSSAFSQQRAVFPRNPKVKAKALWIKRHREFKVHFFRLKDDHLPDVLK